MYCRVGRKRCGGVCERVERPVVMQRNPEQIDKEVAETMALESVPATRCQSIIRAENVARTTHARSRLRPRCVYNDQI